jgi:glyoxylase-like metal-dependent hydrolase (beta-lactamase superfamily II)
MILHHFRDPHCLVNSFLLAERVGGSAVLMDTGGPLEQILARCDELQVRPKWILNTHRHSDHVTHNQQLAEFFGATIVAHALEATAIPGVGMFLDDGQRLNVGGMSIQALHVPGHTSGHLAYVVEGLGVFSGDVLFAGSVGGTRGVGHTSLADLQHSVMQKLMTLSAETVVFPGHMENTQIGFEWQNNPFIRWWRGLLDSVERPCLAAGLNATLIHRAQDYDGGSKCLVRFADGALDLVAGSQVSD